jgi:receptor protein-tyrosine kinase
MKRTKASGRSRARWWIVALFVVLGGLAGIAFSAFQTPQYTSVARLFVGTNGGTTSSESYQGDQFSQQRAVSYAQILSSELLAQRVVDTLALPDSASSIAADTTATVVPKTVLIEVSVKNPSANRASEIANTLSTEFIDYITPLETPVGQSQPRTTVSVVDAAEPASSPSSPNTMSNALIGAVVGTLIGIGLALFLNRRAARSFATAPALAKATGLPVLGSVSNRADGESTDLDAALVADPAAVTTDDVAVRSADGDLVDSDTETTSERILVAKESFRRLRVRLEASEVRPKVILVTGVGDSTHRTSLNLAIAYAETDSSTVIVETDHTRPQLASLLQLSGNSGLINVLSEELKPDEATQESGSANLSVLTVGSGSNIEPLLPSQRMTDTIRALLDSHDYVIIDTPPSNTSSAGAVLAGRCDATVLVVDPTKASRSEIVLVADDLKASGAPLYAVVLDQ